MCSLLELLEECRDFVSNCVGSTYHDTDKSDEEFLAKLDSEITALRYELVSHHKD